MFEQSHSWDYLGYPDKSVIQKNHGNYQAAEQAGVARLSWRVSGR